MIYCKYFPDKKFATKNEVFAELRKHEKIIIGAKKAGVFKSYEKIDYSLGFMLKTADVEIGKTGPQMKDGFIYPVINTTRYMDMHDDVHFDGLWNKSVKEQQGKLYYVADHEIKVNSIIAWPGDVKVMTKSIPWSFVGKDYPGNTEALIYEIDKKNIVHEKAREIIDEKRPVQNSVRMMYMKIQLGMDSGRKDDAQYKAYYDSKIGDIVNREVVEEQGYFFGVEEAKIIKEGSMVIFGSNDATTIGQKNDIHIEPLLSTQNRAVKDTRILKELSTLLSLTKKIQ